MKSFLQEYGLLIISVIVASMVLIIWSKLINNDNGLSFIYNTNSMFQELKDTISGNEEDIMDSFAGVKNSVANAYSPYFKINDSINIDDTFRLNEDDLFEKVEDVNNTSDGYHYRLVLKDKDINALKNRLTSDFNGIQIIKRSKSGEEKETDISKLTVVIVESRPSIGYVVVDGVAKEQYLLEDIDALDKFGNRIIDKDSNTFVKSSQVAYDTIIWNIDGKASNISEDDNAEYRKLDEFSINPEIPSRYRVIYRYQDGALKCEYTKMFLNEVRTEYDILFGKDPEGGESTD